MVLRALLTRRRAVVAAGVAAGTLVALEPPPAAAETVKLGWREEDGVGVMRFTVETLSLAKGRWRVHASFTNLSQVPLAFERRFSLLAYGTRDPYGPFRTFAAGSFEPPLPMRVLPGRTWRGSFAGVGVPNRGTYVRLRFGRFKGTPSPLPEFPVGFSWITSNAYLLR